MKHLIRQWIDAFHANGQCPRLMVDATLPAVEVPERVREQWGQAMPIDLDPSYPLELRMDERGVHCSLSFGGPFDCFFPWESIYVVQDRDSQIGVVIEEHLPDRFQLVDDESDSVVPRPRESGQAADASTQADPDRESPAEPPKKPVRMVDPQPAVQPVAEVEPEYPDSAEARRARFRVIDGGKR